MWKLLLVLSNMEFINEKAKIRNEKIFIYGVSRCETVIL